MKKEKNQNIKFIFAFIFLLILTVFTVWFLYFKGDIFEKRNIFSDEVKIIRESKNIEIELTQEDVDGIYNEHKAKINLNDLSIIGNGAYEERSVITIAKSGVYYFYGQNENANIIVDAKDGEVVLVFDNVKLTSINTAVINCISAKKLTINIPEGTRTELDDGNNYSEFTGEDEPNSLIYCKADLIINGKGTLRVKANYKDGIFAQGNLKILNNTVSINAKENGIVGKSVFFNESSMSITSNKTGIETTDEENGFVFVMNGETSLTSHGNGIYAKSEASINDNAIINIAVDGEEESSFALKAGKEVTINSSIINIESTGVGIQSDGYMIINGENISVSARKKAFFSENSLIINKGTINITSSDKGIESHYIEIADGQLMLKTDGCALESNGSILVKGGKVEIAGPTDNQNGPINYKRSFDMDGGEMLYYGAVGMWKDASPSSTLNTASFIVFANQGDVVKILNDNDEEIVVVNLAKGMQRFSYSSNKIEIGKTYRILINDEEKSKLVVNNVVTIDQITSQQEL